MEYIFHILIMICIYIILSASLNLTTGYTGLLSLCQAAFYGIGAYAYALMALRIRIPYLLIFLIVAFICALIGYFIGIISSRFQENYFVIFTFAFQMIIFSLFNNLSLTGGSIGLSGIPRPHILPLIVSFKVEMLIISICLCLVSLWISRKVIFSPFGRVLTAIREDEIYAMALGKNVSKHKILIFMLGASMAGISGCLYASYISFIDPISFTIMESLYIICIIIIGGIGSYWGPVVGSFALVLAPEVLRFIGLSTSIAENIRQILYGGLLIAFIMLRPQGIIGKFIFQRRKSL